MSANPLGHLTIAQIEAAEDYLGAELGSESAVSKVRALVIAAWAGLLRERPTALLADLQEMTFDQVQALAEANNDAAARLGEA